MRFNSVALLTGATAVAAGNTANLLLPGFEGRDLQASVLGSAGAVTTYLVSCPQTVAPAACGIPGNRMTAVSAPGLMQLTQVANTNTALLNCNVAGQTYASCSAQSGTLAVQSTLAPNNLNWMAVTVTSESTSTPTPTPTPTPSSTVTPTSTATPSSTATPCTSTSTPTSTPTSTATPSSFMSSTPISSMKVTSTPLGAPSSTPVIGTPVPSQTPSTPGGTNGAASLSGNNWALGGAVLALVYALA